MNPIMVQTQAAVETVLRSTGVKLSSTATRLSFERVMICVPLRR